MIAGETGFAWSIPRNDPRRPKLYRALFGQKSVKVMADGSEKIYTYDGILTKFVNGKEVVDCRHAVLGESLIAIPDMEKKFIGPITEVFRELKIPVRLLRITDNDLMTWKE